MICWRVLTGGLGVAIALVLLSIFSTAHAGGAQKAQGLDFSAYVTENGEIRLPDEFRTRFVHLGSWFVPQESDAPGAGLHDVYTQKATVKAYRESGEFPDGAVLVKEVRQVDSANLPTGNAHWGADVGLWFVMVRDREERFPDNPKFGGGWGWGLFKPDAPEKDVATSWKGEGFSNCYGCHLPAKETQWVFVQGYPTLK